MVVIMLCRTLIIVTVFLFVIDCGGAGSREFPSDEDGSLPVVHTLVGSIRGLRAEDGNYSMYMGIPYAHVDPDNLFGNAKPHPNFESVFDAFDDTAICPQEEEFNHTIVGSLDCLHINVYVPDSATDDKRLPVLVWIHGGGFSYGFAGRYHYGPSFLVRHDIIFVTLNYRLGPYGFMCLDTPEVPGNQGLKDQVMALKWVRDNIGAFGGDNSKITIAGCSAGGISVDYHLYYDQETNLYQRIIPQSGVAMSPGLIRQSNPDRPFELAKILNYTASDLQDALSFLATVDPHKVVAASLEIGPMSFLPCVEKEFENVERFIHALPINMQVPRVKDIEVLIGLSDDEGYTVFAEASKNKDFARFWVEYFFDFAHQPERFAEIYNIVSHFYFGGKNKTEDLKRLVVDISSDFYFNYPTLRTVKKYLDNGAQVMYFYMFSYSGGRNFNKHRLNMTGGRASHADELGYLFDIFYMDKPLDPNDQLIVDRITELWANFIKYGNPTPQPNKLVPVLWQPVTKDELHYLDLNTEVTVSMWPFHQRTAFLELLFKANEIYERGLEREQIEEESSFGRNLVLILLGVLVLRHFL